MDTDYNSLRGFKTNLETHLFRQV